MQFHLTRQGQLEFERQLRSAVSRRAMNATRALEKYLFQEAVLLTGQILGSQAWSDLKGRLVGEFGFAPWEVNDLDEIVRYTIPSNKVTKLDVVVNTSHTHAILHWIDWNEFAYSAFAEHELTKRDSKTKAWKVEQIVSWVEWLEFGATIRGYEFVSPLQPRQRFFSRSGQGLMKPAEGKFWSFEPTFVFRNTARTFDPNDMKDHFALMMSKKPR